MAAHSSGQPDDHALCMLWLLPFLLSSSLVASARHRHDWESTPIQLAMVFTVLAIGYSAVSFHKSPPVDRRDRLGQMAFLVFISLSAFVIIARVLFPIPSSPFSDQARINRILDVLLLWPFLGCTLLAVGFAASSPSWRHSLFLSFSAILMVMLALSMHGNWLRSLNSLVT